MAGSAPRALFGDETYIRVRPIGEGSTGEVWLCLNRCAYRAVSYVCAPERMLGSDIGRHCWDLSCHSPESFRDWSAFSDWSFEQSGSFVFVLSHEKLGNTF